MFPAVGPDLVVVVGAAVVVVVTNGAAASGLVGAPGPQAVAAADIVIIATMATITRRTAERLPGRRVPRAARPAGRRPLTSVGQCESEARSGPEPAVVRVVVGTPVGVENLGQLFQQGLSPLRLQDSVV